MEVKAFNAIRDFVKDLSHAFSDNKKTPLSLYKRLLTKIDEKDEESVRKAVSGFQVFFAQNERYIIGPKLDLPPHTKIFYGTSDKIFLELSSYLSRSDKETKVVIKNHLIFIDSIVNPGRVRATPENPEEEFLENMIEEVGSVMEGFGENMDPKQAIMQMFASGSFQNMINGVKEAANEGKFDKKRFVRALKKTMDKVSNMLDDDVNTSVQEMSSLTVREASSSASQQRTSEAQDSQDPK